jgi:outer membrane protein OmpA-like peptidoglycan-associated protein
MDMRTHIKTLLAASSALALVACGDASVSNWNNEAGSQIDEGNFGNPTMNNSLVMRGEAQVAEILNSRFQAQVPTMINFDFDSAVLDAEAQAILRQQADWIRQFPEIRFRVYGHTDLVGSAAYNQQLGLRRAQAAVRYLETQGISRSRLEAVTSFGKTRPLVNTTEPNRENRRTVTQVMGWAKGQPTPLDGKYGAVIYREYVNSARPRSTVQGGLGAIEAAGG